MNTEPLTLALREIAETRGLLESLITSSESFNYPRAKVALELLTQKIRDLSKLQARFQEESQRALHPSIAMPDFQRATARPHP